MVDLATTKSLLDMQDRDRQAANVGASTSTPATTKSRIPTQAKGKKTPSKSDTPMASAGSKQAVSSSTDDSGKHALDSGDSDWEVSSKDSDGNKWVPLWRTIRKKKLVQGDCEDSQGCGTPPPALAHPLARIWFDIKPKDPPAYHGKATEDVEMWS